jgi:hypothetical protein
MSSSRAKPSATDPEMMEPSFLERRFQRCLEEMEWDRPNKAAVEAVEEVASLPRALAGSVFAPVAGTELLMQEDSPAISRNAPNAGQA